MAISLRGAKQCCLFALLAGLFVFQLVAPHAQEDLGSIGRALDYMASTGITPLAGYRFQGKVWDSAPLVCQQRCTMCLPELIEVRDCPDPTTGLLTTGAGRRYLVAVDEREKKVFPLRGFGAKDIEGLNEVTRLLSSRGCLVEEKELVSLYAAVQRGIWVQAEDQCKQAFLDSAKMAEGLGIEASKTLWRKQDPQSIAIVLQVASSQSAGQRPYVEYVYFLRGLEKVVIEGAQGQPPRIVEVKWAKVWQWDD